jgi:hypothetical protein
VKIKSVILSRLIYINNNQFNLTIAVAFSHRVTLNQTTLIINPAPALANPINMDSRTINHPIVNKRNTGKYIHFNLSNLNCNQQYTYHVEVNNQRINISKLYRQEN